MKSYLLILFSICFTISVNAQTQTFPGDLSDIKISPVYHGSLVLEYDDLVVYVDPYGGAERYSMFKDPDVLMITHAHGDHFDPETLKGLNLEHTHLIAPGVIVNQLTANQFGFETITQLVNGEDATIGIMDVIALPMYNPEEGGYHERGVGNGYIILFGETSIYISGDTGIIPEMGSEDHFDIAFVCMNLPYTMDVEKAAQEVIKLLPGTVYPYHYRGKDEFSNIRLFKKLVDEADLGIRVELLNWYPGEYTLED